MTLSVTGQQPFSVTGTGGPGTWTGNTWTSDVISAGTNYNINIQDANACNSINVASAAPNCCIFNVVCPTFQLLALQCYDELPPAGNLTTAQFEALGNGNGRITNNSCGTIEITASNGPDPGCNGTVTRTYTITQYEDPNNNDLRDIGENTVVNSAVCIQAITIHDTTAPVFAEPLPDAVINTDCEAVPDPALLTATDNCSNASISFTETRIDGGCSSRYSLARTWTASDQCGNQSTFTQTINVSCLLNVFNAISPNADGRNDTFIIEGIDCFPNNTVKIYNRYGVVVYEKNSYDNVTNPFEGFSDGRATVLRKDKLPTGTYFYTLEYEDNSSRANKSGYLYINNQ